MADTVKIGCRVLNGTTLRLFKKGYDDGTGFHPMVVDGPPVRLAGPSALNAGAGASEGFNEQAAVTEVDADFAAKWFEQNAQSPFVTDQLIYRVQEEKPRPEGEAA